MNWNDITIQKYQELANLTSEDKITLDINRLSIILDIDSQDVRDYNILEFRDKVKQLDFLNENIPSDLNNIIEVEGKEYGIIPNFDFISTGEFIDLESLCKDSINNMHLIMAVLYRPVIKKEGETYKISKHKTSGFSERANLFKQLPISKVYGSYLFFCALAATCIKHMEDYLLTSN